MTRLELALVVDLAGLLDHLVGHIRGAETAILLSADGTATASSARTAAEVSLPASTLRALAEAAARLRRVGPVWRTIVALDHQLFALAPAGPDAVLGVTLDGRATLDSVLTDTATAAERAGRVLAAHDVHAAPPTTVRRRTYRWSLAQLTGCDPNPSDDQLERMLTRLRSL